MIEDVIGESGKRLSALAPPSADAVRLSDAAVVGFSQAMSVADRGIKDFLYAGMYRHPRIIRIMGEAEQVVLQLFDRYTSNPRDLPPEWASDTGTEEGPRRIADFIAGMTDRYALAEHARFFDLTPDLR
jgi:dGTPase